MKKVLIASAADLERGGVQNFILEWVKAAPEGEFQFSWYFPGKIWDKTYAEIFKKSGIILYSGNQNLRDAKISLVKCAKDLRQLFIQEKFDIIHVNTGYIGYQIICLWTAWSHHIKIRIAHSHNAPDRKNHMQKLKLNVERVLLKMGATTYVSCSKKASLWMFGKYKNIILVKNRIYIPEFQFHDEIRKIYRKQLGVSEKTCVLGAVGTLNNIKNHKFLLDIMSQLKEEHLNVILIICGDGPLHNMLEMQITRDNLQGSVRLLGVSSCVSNWLQAFDIFIMPSLYEGFPISAIEAQATGLPCIFSDTITQECQLLDRVCFLSLNNIEAWKMAIRNAHEFKYSSQERKKAAQIVEKQGFAISNLKEDVKKLYCENSKNRSVQSCKS